MFGDRWGVTEAEVGQHFPCDDLVPAPALALWRGVTVQAPPEAVWPWLRQLRVAPYSYDWIDNAGRRSPRALVDLPDPCPGDPFSTFAGSRDVGRIVAVEPGRQLTATVMGTLMSYVLSAEGETTRLLLKVVLPQQRWYGRALALGDWPMARRQLLTLKHLAEGSGAGGRLQ
ncbi:MAG: polyketide cyclase [Frankiales bacterium]|nr:polyketide cyclase [Frankiales bacterium]